MYLNTFIERAKTYLIKMIALVLTVSMAVPIEMVSILGNSDTNVSHGYTVGSSGSVSASGGESAGAGIDYRPCWKVGVVYSSEDKNPPNKFLIKPETVGNTTGGEEYSLWRYRVVNGNGAAKLSASTVFIPPCFSNLRLSLGYYSNGVIKYAGGTQITEMTLPGSGAGDVYYSQIRTALENGDESFFNSGWKSIIGSGSSKKNSLQNWSYVLGSPGYSGSGKNGMDFRITERARQVFEYKNGAYKYENYATWKDNADAKLGTKAKFADMLMQLYTVSAHPTVKSNIEKGITQLLKGNFENDAFAVIIVPEVLVKNVGGANIILSTVDYFQFMTHTREAWKMECDPFKRNVNANKRDAREHFYQLEKYSVDSTIAEEPKYNRISDSYKQSNVFSFGAYGLSWGTISTKGGAFNLRSGGSTSSRINEYAWLSGKGTTGGDIYGNNSSMWAQNHISYIPTETSTGFIGKLQATPDDQLVNANQYGGALHYNVDLNVYPNLLTDTEKNYWYTLIEQAKSTGREFNCSIKLNSIRVSSVNEWNGTATSYMIPENSDGSVLLLDADVLKNAIQSNSPLLANVDLTGDLPIIETGAQYKATITYQMDFKVTCDLDGNGIIDPKTETWTVKSPEDARDDASFIIPEKSPERIRYVSTPEAYAELKNYGPGSNQSGTLKEEYEVMAGVPTTEQLYFAAGGSEFVVDVSLEYVEDETAVRSYTSFFHGIECEYHGVGQDGMTTQTTGTYSKSGNVDGDVGGSWSVSTSDTQITCGCEECGGDGDWIVTITCSYANECSYSTCAGGENSQIITNGSGAYNEMVAALNEIEASMDKDASAFTYTSKSDQLTRKGTVFSWTSPPARKTPDGNGGSSGCGPAHGKCGGCTDSKGKNKCRSGTKCKSGSQGTDTFTITGTWPRHYICGPCCSHHLPDLFDTWSQSWTYDTIKIIDAHVWRIDQAAAYDLSDVIGPGVDNDVDYTAGVVAGTDGPYENPNSLDDGTAGARLKAGIPNIFYNIAMKVSNDLPGHDENLTFVEQDGIGKATEMSLCGRVRYNVGGGWADAPQHDQVFYDLGTRTNKCDGMAKTVSPCDQPAGGKGHAEKWAPGFIYNGFKGAATHTGHDSPAVNEADTQRSAVQDGIGTDYFVSDHWNDGGQTNYPLNSKYYLDKHCDGVASDYATFYKLTADTTSNEGRLDVNTPEFAAFKEKRQQPCQASMMSDFLILQTTSGDQCLMYYQFDSEMDEPHIKSTGQYLNKYEYKETGVDANNNKIYSIEPADIKYDDNTVSISVTAEDMIPTIEITKQTMWDNNGLTASSWTEDAINVGGYNGGYSNPNTKFNGTANARINQPTKIGTIFDKDPAKEIVRPARPTRKLMLYSLPLNIILENENMSYLEDNMQSDVFWTNRLHWSDVTAKSMGINQNPIEPDYPVHDTLRTVGNDGTGFEFGNHTDEAKNALVTEWGQDKRNMENSFQGLIIDAYYSPNTTIELNPLVIHNPVSSTEVSLVSLPDERDQRYAEIYSAGDYYDNLNKNMVCPENPAECQFAVLNCKYGESQSLAEFYFNTDDMVNSITNNKIALPAGWSIANGKLVGGSGANRIQIPMASEFKLVYQPGTKLNVKADVVLSSLPQNTDASVGVMTTRISQMLFGLAGYSLYVSTDGKLGFITADGQYRECNNITLEVGKHYSIDATFAFSYLSSCELTVNGVTATFDSSTIEKKRLASSNIGTSFNIGAMNSMNYGFRGTMDNIRISRVGGGYSHTKDCYVTQMSHPSGMNHHVHDANCLTTGAPVDVQETTVVNRAGDVISEGNTAGTTPVTLKPGKYKLEVWGAQGGNNPSGYTGGLGGYSTGIINLTTQTTLYAHVGGVGNPSTTNGSVNPIGGYNGGGYGYQHPGCNGGSAGGGMTHISTTNNPVVISTSGTTQSASGTGNANADYHVVHSFTASSAGTVTFYSDSYTKDPRGVIRVNGTVKVDDDDSGGNGLNFRATYSFAKGDFVELITYRYGSSGSGTCTWHCTITFGSGSGGVNWNSNGTIIAAGGGGGAGYRGNGGAGGGANQNGGAATSGGAGGTTSSGAYPGVGEGGSVGGSDGTGSRHSGAGGGGWYGGYAATNNYGGGGGSGYVNTSKLTSVSGTPGINSGAGRYKITAAEDITTTTTVSKPDLGGYEYLKSEFEAGRLTVAQLKQMFGDAYELLFITNEYVARYKNFANTADFSNFVNCDLKAYSGNIVESVTGTAPSFIFNKSIRTSDVEKIILTINNNTDAKKAKVYWSSGGGFSEGNSYTVSMLPNTEDQKLVFYVASKDSWVGTVSKLKFVIPADDDKNYGNSIVIKEIALTQAPPETANFHYTGNVQSYRAPINGVYFVETWGASGGNPGTTGSTKTGLGGYSCGAITLAAGQMLYAYVGGQGTYSDAIGISGGYNGGGNGGPGGYGGGGMTHISTDGSDIIKSEGNWVNVIKPGTPINSSNIGDTSTESYGNSYVFDYKGSVQSQYLPAGTYKLEVWGAEGGGSRLSGNSSSGLGGKGGYSTGTITLTSPTTLYIFVGGAGASSTSGLASGGYNGGGSGYASSSSEPGNGGGGMTHISTTNNPAPVNNNNNMATYSITWKHSSGCSYGAVTHTGNGSDITSCAVCGHSCGSRVSYSVISNPNPVQWNPSGTLIVAGGGGGGGEDSTDTYGHGGGLSGVSGKGTAYNGTQTTPGKNGSAGIGGSTGVGDGGGGGGGYYGGGTSSSASVGSDTQGGGGGSGYLSSQLVDSWTLAGNEEFDAPDGSTETGHLGNGYAKITPVSYSTGGAAGGKVVFESGTPGSTSVKLPAGVYKLEVWGAAGGGWGNHGDAPGGYSVGNITLTGEDTLYICCGGKGYCSTHSSNSSTAGYNGGGKDNVTKGSGGGATHIAKNGNHGVLSNYASYKNEVLIVAGGGGSNGWWGTTGRGGGLEGGNGTDNNGGTLNATYDLGGKQTGIGTQGNPGGFGYGGNGTNYGGAGGGGWYGGNGAGGNGANKYSGGGGGSGYVSSVLTDAKTMSGYTSFVSPGGGNETGHSGDGYVRITYLKPAMEVSVANNKATFTGYGRSSITLQPGTYKIEAWGAQGGKYTSGYDGAKGGYTAGTLTLNETKTLYVYLGQMGGSYPNNHSTGYGFNGGGQGFSGGGDGGGATDIRITGGSWNNANSLKSRILVAGGGGGSDNLSQGGVGGGLTGGSTLYPQSGDAATGGTQTSGGTSSGGIAGSFGKGGGNGAVDAGGGGGGYYGGGSGWGGHCAGAGGSSYAAGYDGCDTTYSSYQGGLTFTDVAMQQGVNSGNGKVVITSLSTPGREYQSVDTVQFNTDALVIAAGGGGGSDDAVGTVDGLNDGAGGYGGGLSGGNAYVNRVLTSGNGEAGSRVKVEGGRTWVKVLYQDISSNTNYFTAEEAASGRFVQLGNDNKYMVLDELEQYRGADGKFTFMLEYPDQPEYNGIKNIWKQSSNPWSQQKTNGSGTAANATGYEELSYPMYRSSDGGKGLEYNGGPCVLDGSVNHGNWWLCVGIIGGRYTPTDNQDGLYTMPGPVGVHGGRGARKVALWVAVDNGVFGSNSGLGGTQTSGYKHGLGQSVTTVTDSGGAGGGWWGGLATSHYNGGAGGGSGHLSSKLHSSYVDSNNKNWVAKTINGISSMPNYAANGTNMIGNTGNGYARISFIELTPNKWPTKDDIVDVIDMIPENSPIFRCTKTPNEHVCDKFCQEVSVLNCVEPHHTGNHYDGDDLCYDACMDDANHKLNHSAENKVRPFTPGNFINLDWGFKTYFANLGDFYQSRTHGIGRLTNTRGIGYVNDMDTSDWTRVKRIQFPVNVIYKGNLYKSGEWIVLANKGDYLGEDGSPFDNRNWTEFDNDLYKDLWGNEIDGARNYMYEFYCVEDNNEHNAVTVGNSAIAINDPTAVAEPYGDWRYSLEPTADCGDSNGYPYFTTNKDRYGRYLSKHSSYDQYAIDVVGRIGNLTMLDTGDYRFSNFFKVPEASNVVVPEPTYYTSADNLVPVSEAVVNGDGNIETTKAGDGAKLLNTTLAAGEYRIYIEGTGLTNTTFSVKTKSAWVTEYQMLEGSNYGAGVGMEVITEEKKDDTERVVAMKSTVSGPHVSLKAGEYNLQLLGENLMNAEWHLKGDGADLDPYITKVADSDTSMQWTVEFDSDIHDFEITTEYEDHSLNEISITAFNAYRLDKNVVTELVGTNAVLSMNNSDTSKVYSLKVDNGTTADISVISRGGNVVINKIGIQDAAGAGPVWTVDGIVQSVNIDQQRSYLAYSVDIRGVPTSNLTQYVDTWNTKKWAQTALCVFTFPLDSSKNNINVLKNQAVMVGYDIYTSIDTLGDYYMNSNGYLQVVPEYYLVDARTGELEPADVYIKYNEAYYPIALWGLMTGEDSLFWPGGSGYTLSSLYNFSITLKWDEEKARRMVTPAEDYATNFLKTAYSMYALEGEKYLYTPSASTYIMGNPQFMQLSGRARTFIGGETTYGELLNYSPGDPDTPYSGRDSSSLYKDSRNEIYHNPQGRLPNYEWWAQAQRWHMTLSLPSSSVFLKAGTVPSTEEVEKITRDKNYYVLATVDIRATGNVWNLIYDQNNGNMKIYDETGACRTYTIPESITVKGVKHRIPTPLVIYQFQEADKEIDIIGNH